ncbi:hypothetical protein GEMRC1_000096 [Eukaryota sp. GEM-RC1]
MASSPQVELLPHIDIIKECSVFVFQNIDKRGSVSALIDPIINKMTVRTRGSHSSDSFVRIPKSPHVFDYSQRYLYIQYCSHGSFIITVDTESHSGTSYRTCISSSLSKKSKPRIAPLAVTYPSSVDVSKWVQVAIDLHKSYPSPSYDFRSLKSLTIGGSISFRSIFLSNALYVAHAPPPSVAFPSPPRSLPWNEVYSHDWIPEKLARSKRFTADPRTLKQLSSFLKSGKELGSTRNTARHVLPAPPSTPVSSHSSPSLTPVVSSLVHENNVLLRYSHIFGFNAFSSFSVLPTFGRCNKSFLLLFSVGSFLVIKVDDAPTSINFDQPNEAVISLMLPGNGFISLLDGVSLPQTQSHHVTDDSSGLTIKREDATVVVRVLTVHTNNYETLAPLSLRLWSIVLLHDQLSLCDIKHVPLSLVDTDLKSILDLSWAPDGNSIALLIANNTASLRLVFLSLDLDQNTLKFSQSLEVSRPGAYSPRYLNKVRYNSDGSRLTVCYNNKIRTFLLSTTPIRSISLVLEGTTLSSTDDVAVTSFSHGWIDHDDTVLEVVFVGLSDGNVFVSDETWTKMSMGYHVHSGPVTSLDFSKSLCISGGKDCFARVWPTRPKPFSAFYTEKMLSITVAKTSISEDGRFAVVADLEGLTVFDLATKCHSVVHSSMNLIRSSGESKSTLSDGREVNKFIQNVSNTLSCITVNESKGEVAIADFFENLIIFDLDTGSQLYEFTIPGAVSVAQFSTTKYELICGSHDGFLYIVDIVNTSPVCSVEICEGKRIVDVKVKVDGNLLVCDESGVLYVLKREENVVRVCKSFTVLNNPSYFKICSKEKFAIAVDQVGCRLICTARPTLGYELICNLGQKPPIVTFSNSFVAIIQQDDESFNFFVEIFKFPLSFPSQLNQSASSTLVSLHPHYSFRFSLPFDAPIADTMATFTPSILNVVSKNQLLYFLLI